MNTAIDSTRIFTRHQVDDLLVATIGKTLLQVDKTQLFAHHEGRDKVKLHDEKVPVTFTKEFPEFIQRIPIMVYIVCNANSAMPSVIF